MEELPDDVLLCILERIGEYKQIARSAPLVCRRWDRLCCTRLSKLQIDCLEVGYGIERLLARVVSSNRKSINTLKLYSSEMESSTDLFPSAEATFRLVNLLKATVESVDICGNTQHASYGHIRIAHNAKVYRKLLVQLLACRRLKELKLTTFHLIFDGLWLQPAPPWPGLLELHLSNVVLTDRHLEELLCLCPALQLLHIDCMGLHSPKLILSEVTTLRVGTAGKLLVLSAPKLRRMEHVSTIRRYQPGGVELQGVVELDLVVLKWDSKLISRSLLWIERLETHWLASLEITGGHKCGLRSLNITTGLLDKQVDLSPFSDTLEELIGPICRTELEQLFTGHLPRLKKACLRIIMCADQVESNVDALGRWLPMFTARCGDELSSIELSVAVLRSGGVDVDMKRRYVSSRLPRCLQEGLLCVKTSEIIVTAEYGRERDRSRGRYEL